MQEPDLPFLESDAEIILVPHSPYVLDWSLWVRLFAFYVELRRMLTMLLQRRTKVAMDLQSNMKLNPSRHCWRRLKKSREVFQRPRTFCWNYRDFLRPRTR